MYQGIKTEFGRKAYINIMSSRRSLSSMRFLFAIHHRLAVETEGWQGITSSEI
jgi:hypothetical protein